MNVTYAHANPRSGHESYVIKFTDETSGQTSCVLVDAGRNVRVEELLDDDEYLAAVVLTHAHVDHYRSLGAVVRDGAPVYASPATANLLETVLTENRDTYELPDPTPALEALEAITDWEQVAPGIAVRPVPAGHAPGGVGYVFRFEAGGTNRYVLATGDFSFRRAGGYPAFTTDLPRPIDAMFLNVASTDRGCRGDDGSEPEDADGEHRYEYETELTDSIATLFERIRAGSNVLLSTSGLTGVKYATLLDSLADRYADVDLEPITLVGHAAKLFEDLEYDRSNVETVPVFDDPAAIVDRSGVTIAGPEVPTAGSSGQLFRTIRDDPGATLVQVTAGASSPVERAACTVYEYTLIDHPTDAELEGVIDDFAPIQLIVEHQRPGDASFRSNENSFVWEHADRTEYVLYDGNWRPPPWMTDEGRRLVVQNNPRIRTGAGTGTMMGTQRQNLDPLSDGGRVDAADTDRESSFPSIDRRPAIDYEAEGVAIDRLDERFDSTSSPRAASDDTRVRDSSAEPSRSVGAADRSEPDALESDVDGDATDESDSSDLETGRSDSSAASGGEPTETAEPTLEDVLDRLDAIESRLSIATREIPATVVDAGDGVVLLRPDESELPSSLASLASLASRADGRNAGAGDSDGTGESEGEPEDEDQDENETEREPTLEHGDTVYLTVSTEPSAPLEPRRAEREEDEDEDDTERRRES